MTDDQLLLAISSMMDSKLKSELKPIKNDMRQMKNEFRKTKFFQENYADRMEAAFADIELLKRAVEE